MMLLIHLKEDKVLLPLQVVSLMQIVGVTAGCYCTVHTDDSNPRGVPDPGGWLR